MLSINVCVDTVECSRASHIGAKDKKGKKGKRKDQILAFSGVDTSSQIVIIMTLIQKHHPTNQVQTIALI